MIEQQIFKKRSTTYFASSRLFPPQIQEDVAKLYSFLRTADDYVDLLPQNPKKLSELKQLWQKALNKPGEPHTDDSINGLVVKNMAELVAQYDFVPGWIDSFLSAMEIDIKKTSFVSIEEVLDYVYGSAEVTGLMMSRILGAPKIADEYAKIQGRAMQWLNFIRDISEDNGLGRCYFPQEELAKYQLTDLNFITTRQKSKEFKAFINFQLSRYHKWQDEAAKGYKYIPSNMLIAVKNAVLQYDNAAERIKNNPFTIYD